MLLFGTGAYQILFQVFLDASPEILLPGRLVTFFLDVIGQFVGAPHRKDPITLIMPCRKIFIAFFWSLHLEDQVCIFFKEDFVISCSSHESEPLTFN
jgi:hypothetical protein